MHKATAYKYSLDVRILLEPLSVLPYLGTGSPSEAGALAADRDHLDATPFCKKSTKCHDHKRAYARTHAPRGIHTQTRKCLQSNHVVCCNDHSTYSIYKFNNKPMDVAAFFREAQFDRGAFIWLAG